MKLEVCSFTGYKVYPSRGRTFIRGDGRTFRFLDSKTESLFHQNKNPRKLAWTPIFRKIHRKGISEEVAKKRTRRNVKYARAIVGLSLDAINARRNEKPEARSAARAEAVAKLKAARKEEAAKKKAARTAATPQGGNQKFSKQQARGAPTKVKATTR
ncbi:60S ribosomal protein L24 [Coemansia thaxteri]|uniref:60S ribosomal protein L24 n=1 Tax=Coemansia thaxteri TaxID=2663907 RepID=A0A9W8EJ70_9FUNG|nr:60S ribosomal protein L24 [Coemansia thaxteri]KAJ2003950.1 60S ribosomal protein L24 [Coemansia thaxteri]KAJ2472291.1 60S ribosomal protein L24 [Coemansia sp. RSA 2322]